MLNIQDRLAAIIANIIAMTGISAIIWFMSFILHNVPGVGDSKANKT